MGKPRSTGEALGTFGNQHDVAGVLVDLAGDEADVLDVADAADGASGTGGPVHAAGVELDDAFFIGKAAEADAVVFGIVFAAEADVVDGVESVLAIEEHLVGLLDGVVAGDAGDDDGIRGGLELFDGIGGLREGVGEGEARGGERAEREKIAPCSHAGHGSKRQGLRIRVLRDWRPVIRDQ